jgi:hypothetical protein
MDSFEISLYFFKKKGIYFMTAETFLFYVFSSIALISGVMVIRSRNPVHSVLFLILVCGKKLELVF